MTVSERRIEVLMALQRGVPMRHIARRLGVPLRTVIADKLVMRRDGVTIMKGKG